MLLKFNYNLYEFLWFVNVVGKRLHIPAKVSNPKINDIKSHDFPFSEMIIMFVAWNFTHGVLFETKIFPVIGSQLGEMSVIMDLQR